MSKLQIILARLLLAAMLACGAGQAAAGPLYKVSIDTASLGTGPAFLGLYFIGLADATPATALVTNLAGELLGTPDVSGTVSGAAPGPLAFSNADGGSDWVQAVMLGGVYSFDVNLLVGQGDAGSTFGWALFNDTSYLGADGDLGTVSVQPVLGGNPQFVLASASPLVDVQVVAEPGSAWLLLLAGLPLLAFTRRRA
jgi:hypothetical protein